MVLPTRSLPLLHPIIHQPPVRLSLAAETQALAQPPGVGRLSLGTLRYAYGMGHRMLFSKELLTDAPAPKIILLGLRKYLFSFLSLSHYLLSAGR